MKHDFKKSAELMNAYLRGEEVDRVPYMLLVDEAGGCRVSGLSVQEMVATGAKKIAEVTIRGYDVFDIDFNACGLVVVPYLGGAFEANAMAVASGKPPTLEWKDYGCPFTHEGKIAETEKDIESLVTPDHLKDYYWKILLDAQAIVQEKLGFPLGCMTSTTWSQVLTLRGAQAYIDTIRNPDLLLKLCQKIYDSQRDYVQAFIKVMGKPLILMNAEYAFNRECISFEDAWKYEGQWIAKICKEFDLPLMHHNCGFDPYWDELIDRTDEVGVKQAGVNGSHPLDLDYWVGFQERHPAIAMMGGSVFVHAELELGTPADVEERVRQNIVKLATNSKGSYCSCPVCCMPWRIPMENMMAVGDATRKYGKYPIKDTGQVPGSRIFSKDLGYKKVKAKYEV